VAGWSRPPGLLVTDLAGALPVIQEAVAILRQLAAAYPDQYRPDLARSLQILTLVLGGLRHAGEAQAAP
jgi:hypothetical protein